MILSLYQNLMSGRLFHPFLLLFLLSMALLWLFEPRLKVSSVESTEIPLRLRFVSRQLNSSLDKSDVGKRLHTAAAQSRQQRGRSEQGEVNADILQNYLAAIRDRVEQKKHYPRRERLAGREGMVRVGFAIHCSGRLLTLKISAHSPHPGLNRAALSSVRQAQPFPAFPEELSQERLRLEYGLNFRLDAGK